MKRRWLAHGSSVESIPDLRLLLAGSLACGALLLWLAWRPSSIGTGLPVCYWLSLGTIHILGAWVSTLPASPVENAVLVALGFRECFAGLLAFTVGVLLVEIWPPQRRRRAEKPSLSHRQHRDSAAKSIRGTRPALAPTSTRWREPGPRTYILLGLVCAVAFHFSKSIPSIAALLHCGAYLVVAGFCLGCFVAVKNGRTGQMLLWLIAVGAFPLFTMLTVGFIGYGVYAALMVLCFALVKFRPRRLAFCGMGVLAYLGASLYVTYMRDRDEFRETVWQGHSYSDRTAKLVQMFGSFEFFRPDNERQLRAIDDRLNQNYLVGAACAHLYFGMVPWAHGRTLGRAVVALVPRIFWPGKPVVAGSGDIVSEYTGMVFAEDTSVGVGQVMEFYINFSRCGVIVGFLCLGVLLRILDWQAARCLEIWNVPGFVLWYLPALAFLQPGGSLVEVFGTCAASIVVAMLANRLCGLRANQGRSAPKLATVRKGSSLPHATRA